MIIAASGGGPRHSGRRRLRRLKNITRKGKMMKKELLLPLLALLVPATMVVVWHGFSPESAESVERARIAAGTIDPAVWGKAYPIQYEMWKKTEEPAGKGSKYKRGFDADRVTYDKLAEFPYMALLFN